MWEGKTPPSQRQACGMYMILKKHKKITKVTDHHILQKRTEAKAANMQIKFEKLQLKYVKLPIRGEFA